MDHKIPAEIHVEKAVGGEDGYLQLRDFLHAGGNRLNLNIDFSVVYKNGNGLDQDRQIARYIDKRVAYLANYSPSSFLKTTARSAYLVDPQSYAGIADRFLESNARLNNPNVFVSSIGSYLWGNYNEKSPLERDQSKLYAVQAQKKLKDAGYRVMIDGGNDYALANADHITDISVENGGYAITSYSVPFVGMVLHGYVDYSGPPLNKQRNYETSLLKNIESGAGLNYWLMTEDPKIFAQTAYTDMYNISSETWLERICQTYTELQTVFEPLKDCTITGHARLQDNVTETRYSDGTRILVNGNASDVTVGADTISAYSYKVIKG